MNTEHNLERRHGAPRYASPFPLAIFLRMFARVARRSLIASARLRAPVRTIVSACARRARRETLTRRATAKKYTKEHELIAYDSDSRTGTMSISDYAQESLGQVAFVELPSLGADVKQEGACARMPPCAAWLTARAQRTSGRWRAPRPRLILCVAARSGRVDADARVLSTRRFRARSSL